MNVFVTGGAGYIGSVCTEELLNAGHQVTIFDNLTEGHRLALDPRAKFIEGDLANRDQILPAVAAALGIAVALRGKASLAMARLALPLVAGVSFTLFLHLLGRRTEERFLLPASLFLLPYAAVLFDRAWERTTSGLAWSFARPALMLAAALAVVLAVRGVASMDATLLVDPRYAAERFLAALPAGAHVEVVGSPMFLPRMPGSVVAVRPGVEPVADRQRIPGIEELVDPLLDPRPRAPAAIVVADGATPAEIVTMVRPFGQMQYRDPVSLAFFRGLMDGSLGYERTLRATCSLPWPLECRRVHESTAGEVWIYEPSRSSITGDALP